MLNAKRIVIATLFGIMVLSGVAYYYYLDDQPVLSMEEQTINESGQSKDYSVEEELIKQHLQTINGNGYRIISIDFPFHKLINDNVLLIYTDIVMEKDDLYDWMRLKAILKDGSIAAMERLDIPYYERVQPVDRFPFKVDETIREALQSLSTGDRQLFGMNLRGFQMGSEGINRVDVQDIVPLAANEEATEVVANVSVSMEVLDRVKKGAYLLFLKQYEHEKWQIEDIKILGGSE